MHFTYSDPNSESKNNVDLSQGDILRRTPELDAILKEYHPYYEQNIHNKYFIVLTQTCDLVRRSGIHCKSKYIAIAPVRSLTLVVKKKIESYKDKKINFDIPVCSDKFEKLIENFLKKLFNNNETEYFYLHEDKSLQFPESCCVFLRLSISIKAKENYKTCMMARTLGLNESFRDKLGWVLGQIYSRVGTQDWERNKLEEMLKKQLADAAVWVPDKQIKELRKTYDVWKEDNTDQTLDQNSFNQMRKSLKSKKTSVMEIISEELSLSPKIVNLLEDGTLERKDLKKIINRLDSHPLLASFLR